jgi:putative transposase
MTLKGKVGCAEAAPKPTRRGNRGSGEPYAVTSCTYWFGEGGTGDPARDDRPLLYGFEFTHEAVRDWEARFAPLIADQLRAKRRGQVGRSWYVDETYVNVKGKWCYLYRAIDRDGNLVDSMVSEKRDMEAAKRFFKQAVAVVGHAPERVTTDGHDSYPRAIRETLGSDVLHRTNRYLNNRLEQDHRGIKQRYYPMRGFGSVAAASRFCRAFDEVRQFFRVRTTMKQQVSLAHQREVFRHRLEALKAIVLVA